ncbi:MAG: TatD family hydrolase [Bacteroidia bacterium]|nr:TatD family hydrolase [Bacteroidia bacterium]MCF8425943.1 TatD family hydrolase [Bacteroidia bacterium]MCF8446294.1 TatD family hydrolase [Bacteroidia bacterium]
MENQESTLFFNIHTHRKPQHIQEFCIRNAYLKFTENLAVSYALSSGLHPWFVNQYNLEEISMVLESNISQKSIAAIGEIGLDKVAPNYEKQKLAFEHQLKIASEAKLPVVLHIVKAVDDTYQYIKNFKEPIILHGFNGNLAVFQQLNVSGKTYASFGLNLKKPSTKLLDLVQTIPLKNVLFETDNSSAKINEIYEAFAGIRGISLVELKLIVEENFRLVFPQFQFQLKSSGESAR